MTTKIATVNNSDALRAMFLRIRAREELSNAGTAESDQFKRTCAALFGDDVDVFFYATGRDIRAAVGELESEIEANE